MTGLSTKHPTRAIERAYGDVRAIVAGEKEGGAGLLDGLAEAAHGDVDEPAVALLLGVEEVHEQGCGRVTADEWEGRVERARVRRGPLDGDQCVRGGRRPTRTGRGR